MPPRFGTSGLRGLVTELTRSCVTRYVQAFAASCPTGAGVFVGHDLRASSPAIAHDVATAAKAVGLSVRSCGPVPTPALALAAMAQGASAIMVTGSHIPADRNGLKFYTPAGEITKAQEQRIAGALSDVPATGRVGEIHQDTTIMAQYAARYRTAFDGALGGLRVGHYAHSAVGRDGLADLLRELGATVIPLGWSDRFIPVDTEALPDDLRKQLCDWARAHDLDAIVATDADGDRPLLTDENGAVVPGDIIGQITAASLGAETVVTPISSNTGAEKLGAFRQVIRTRIGSPHVIKAMQTAKGGVVGYEANGGFLLGFDAKGLSGPLSVLMTRDAVLPICAVLAQGAAHGISSLVAAQPARFTATARLQKIDPERTRRFLQEMSRSEAALAGFLAPLGCESASLDLTDGVRATFKDQRIVHLRCSGNAPEMRLYAEAETQATAQRTCALLLPKLASALRVSVLD